MKLLADLNWPQVPHVVWRAGRGRRGRKCVQLDLLHEHLSPSTPSHTSIYFSLPHAEKPEYRGAPPAALNYKDWAHSDLWDHHVGVTIFVLCLLPHLSLLICCNYLLGLMSVICHGVGLFSATGYIPHSYCLNRGLANFFIRGPVHCPLDLVGAGL